MVVSSEDRDELRARYGHRCGYCGVSETMVGSQLEIDHFMPPTHGGTDSVDNLVYCCTTCNRFKSDYWPPDDAPESFRLLHPEQDDLSIHVHETSDGWMNGLTPRGWFHIRRLHLNRPALVEMRRMFQREYALRQALEDAQAVKSKLQARIRELEAELEELRELIARLTG